MPLGRPVKDRAGIRYGRLTAIKQAASDGPNARWLCRCECGKYHTVYGHHLESQQVLSCGCGPKGRRNESHGLTDTRVYRVWKQMRQRCENPKAEGYENYGGRGIRVSDEWHSFNTFFDDMGHPPEGTTIDRIKVDGNYCKENCKWSTWTEQHRNRRDNHLISAFGETKCLTEWAQEKGLPVSTLKNRIYRARMSPEKALSAPLYAKQRNLTP